MPPRETLRHSRLDLAQSPVGSRLHSLGPGTREVLLVPSQEWSLFAPVLWKSVSFVLGRRASFFGGFNYPPVDGCSTASCDFDVLTGENDHISFYSSILKQSLFFCFLNFIFLLFISVIMFLISKNYFLFSKCFF